MGAGFDNRTPQDPWYGWIGETRLTQGVLDSDQWLTARPDEPVEDEEPSTSETSTPAEPTKPSDPSADDVAQAFFTGSSRGAKVILPIVAILAALGGAAVAAIPTINRIFGLNIPQPPLPKIPGLN